jgi:hypothetical protein
MAISGTYTFNPDVGDIIEEAYERAGLDLRSAYDLRSARRSLNLLTLEWQNKGINLWTIEEATAIDLVKGTASYDIAVATISLLDVILRTDSGSTTLQTDYRLNRISEPTYATIPNKLTQARPLQYYFDRKEILGAGSLGSADQLSTITLWPIPEKSGKYKILYWRMKRIADTANLASDTEQVPDRFIPAMCAGLAYHVACKHPESAARVPMLKQIYDETFSEAADEDRVKVSARFVPRIANY